MENTAPPQNQLEQVLKNPLIELNKTSRILIKEAKLN